jgi:hypothetical protein
MEYREIRYTVRARIERNEWTVSIHPAGIEGARRVVTGPRERAEPLARSMIDSWHKRMAGKAVRSREARRVAAKHRKAAGAAAAEGLRLPDITTPAQPLRRSQDDDRRV